MTKEASRRSTKMMSFLQSGQKCKGNRRVVLALILVALSNPCQAFAPCDRRNQLQGVQYGLTARVQLHRRDLPRPEISITQWKATSKSPLLQYTNVARSRKALPNDVLELAQSLFRFDGPVPILQAAGINVLLFTLLRKKLLTSLTPEGFAHSMVLGSLLWTTLGWRGWTLCVLYLVFGQLVTKVRFAEKEKRGLAEGRGGRRGPENVWGSAATGLVCAACSIQGASFLGISSDLYILAYVASLSTKLADTFASEIGKAFGKTTFLITSFQRVEPGTEGAVSAEGTAAAVVGGLILSLYGYLVGLIHTPAAVAVSTVAAFVATNVESVLGATLQGKENLSWISNEVVNFLNTLIGAAIAVVLGIFLLGMK